MKPSIRTAIAGTVGVVGLLGVSAVQAAASVTWTSPTDGTIKTVGTTYTPTGQASAFGRGAQNTDLILVLDSSGSMGLGFYDEEGTSCHSGTRCKSVQAWQKQFAIDLVNALPDDGSARVGVVEFDSTATVLRTLTDLSSDKTAVIAAINSVDAAGGTTLPSGQTAAFDMLKNAGSLSDPNTLSGYLVFSDGLSSGNPDATADTHHLTGVDLIAAIAMPGANVATLQGMVNGPDNIFGNADDTGAFIDGSTSLQPVIAALAGGGALVGIDRVDVTMPDGSVHSQVALDPVGHFTAPSSYDIELGPNIWTTVAYAQDQTTTTATVAVLGYEPDQSEIPVPGVLFLLGAGLIGAGAARRCADKRESVINRHRLW